MLKHESAQGSVEGVYIEEKKTEETLRASENYLKAILNSIFTGVVVVDEKTHEIVDANPNALEAIGASKEHVIGKVCHNFICPAEKGKCPISDLGQTVDKSERVLLRANGERVLIIKTVTTTTWRGRKYLVESFLDITERKKMEEKLRESEGELRESLSKLNVILSTLEDGVDIVTCDYVIRYQNKFLKDRFGDLTGKKCYVEYMGFKEPCPFCPMRKAIKYKRTFRAELTGKDGRNYEVISMPLEYPDGHVDALEIVRDITEQKKTQKALKDSEEKYRELINGMNDTAWVIGFDGKFIDVNDAAVKVLGYSREELLSMGPPDIDTSLTVEQIRDLIKRMPADQRQVFETAHTTKSGKTIPVEISSSLVTYQGKQAILSIARNITERKKAEEKVRESEEKYRNLFENARDVILTFDLKGNVTSVNKAAVEYGFKLDEIVGKSILKFIPKKYWPRILTAVAKVARGKPVEGEIEIFTPKGKQIAEYRGNPIKLGEKVVGLQAILRNITERKEMEEKLRQYSEHLEELVQKRTEELLESEKRYSVLVEEASDGVVIVQDGKIVFVNKKTSEIAGYSRDELIGLSLEKLVDEKYHQLVKERYMRRMRGETVPATYEVEFIAKTSERVPVEVSATCIRYQGRPADLTIVRDARERKRMEEERLRLEKLATMGELATMVGHDLRNPLQSIENAIYYLKNECAPKLPVSIPQKAKQMFQVISDSVNYADKIIRDLQDFSAIKTPKLEKTDINAMIKETLSRVHVPANIKLRTKLGALPEINVDEDEIKRVFMNLTTNGLQAMENGGTLTVATKKTEGFVEVRFKDTGIGISKENIEKLFTPFFTTKAKGMGIGLSICKKFIESHGGSIKAESEVGKGTIFTIKLPIHSEGGGEKT